MRDAPGGSEDAFRQAGGHEYRAKPERGVPFGRLRVLSLADAEAAPPRHYLLKGLIAPGEFSLWWGAPKCGKTFLVMRLFFGLALGQGMWNRKAKRCRVLYVAAEGEGGFAGRLMVLRDELGDPGDGFRYIAQRATVGPPALDLKSIIEAAIAMGADIIILDTLARTFGEGDENAAQDMGGYVASVDEIRAETGAHVVVVHHGTKEGSTSRGSGALLGAADLIVKVSKGKDGEPSVALVEMAKDDADGAEMLFRLRMVDLEADEDGDPRRTCVAIEEGSTGKRRKAVTGVNLTALRTLSDLVLTEGQPIPAGPLMPLNTKGAREDRWRAECAARRLSLAENPKDQDRAFRRAAGALRDAGEVSMRDGWAWLLRTDSQSDAQA